MSEVEFKPTPPDWERLAMQAPQLDTLLAQAEALTRLARGAWITLTLGCLYVWLTIAGLRDIQLFIPEEALTLPILNVDISPGGFFVFAPALLLASYFHLHLSLVRLWRCWRALRARGDLVDGLPVADRVAPWMLTALLPHRRNGFDRLARWVAFAFCFAFAPFTIFATGYRYLRAHEMEMTVYHALLIAIAFVSAWRFAAECFRTAEDRRMRVGGQLRVGIDISASFGALVMGALMLTHGAWTPSGWMIALAPHAQLYRAELSRKPDGWSEREMLQIDQRIAFLDACEDRPKDDACIADAASPAGPTREALERDMWNRLAEVTPAALGHQEAAGNRVLWWDSEVYCAEAELIATARNLHGADLRQAYLARAELRCATLTHADLREADLRGADMTRASMEGADIGFARMEGADLRYARMAGADLRYARMAGADLSRARMEGADLSGALMEGANLNNARMERATLISARMEGATLIGARMEGATLIGARMEGAGLRYARMARANLGRARMEGADLRSARMEGANLSDARMERATLISARMEGADLSDAGMEGADLRYARMEGADFSGAAIAGALLHGMTLAESEGVTADQLAAAFGDASVILPGLPAEQAQDCAPIARPPHWPDAILTDLAYHRRAKGWRESIGLASPSMPPVLEFVYIEQNPDHLSEDEFFAPIPPGTPIAPDEIAR